jgi:hypothetical protein
MSSSGAGGYALSLSPFYFPTLWPSPEIPTVRLHTGQLGDRPPSAVTLPGRDPRPEDERIQAILGRPRTVHVDPEQYLPALKALRAGSNTRTADPVLVEGRRGVLVRKVLDSGSAIYGGPLDNLLVDQVVEENARIFEKRPPLGDRIHPLRVEAGARRMEGQGRHRDARVERGVGAGSGRCPVRSIRSRPSWTTSRSRKGASRVRSPADESDRVYSCSRRLVRVAALHIPDGRP